MKTIQNILITAILFNFFGFSQTPVEIKEDNKGSFIEFKLKIMESNKKPYNFTVDEIHFQTQQPIASDSSAILNNS